MAPLARSVLARLLARQGRLADAGGVLAPAERAASPDEVRVLGPVVLARLELAWLSASVDLAAVARPVLEHPAPASSTALRAELSRYLQRAGVAAGPVAGAPEPWASGLRGDWRTAASQWEGRAEPYEQALELLGGDEPARAAGRGLLRSLGAIAVLDAVARLPAPNPGLPA
jgi:hypothetical protein